VDYIPIANPILSLFILSWVEPKRQELGREYFKSSVGLLFALLLGNTLMHLDPTGRPQTVRGIFSLAPVAYFALGISAVISYHLLKCFKQEKMLKKPGESK